MRTLTHVRRLTDTRQSALRALHPIDDIGRLAVESLSNRVAPTRGPADRGGYIDVAAKAAIAIAAWLATGTRPWWGVEVSANQIACQRPAHLERRLLG